MKQDFFVVNLNLDEKIDLFKRILFENINTNMGICKVCGLYSKNELIHPNYIYINIQGPNGPKEYEISQIIIHKKFEDINNYFLVLN